MFLADILLFRLRIHGLTFLKLVSASFQQLCRKYFSDSLFPTLFIASIQHYFFEINLRSFGNLSDSQFNSSASKLFEDICNTCLSRKSTFYLQNYTETCPKFVLAAVQSYCFTFCLRLLRNLFQLHFNFFASKVFSDLCKFCFSRNSLFMIEINQKTFQKLTSLNSTFLP